MTSNPVPMTGKQFKTFWDANWGALLGAPDGNFFADGCELELRLGSGVVPMPDQNNKIPDDALVTIMDGVVISESNRHSHLDTSLVILAQKWLNAESSDTPRNVLVSIPANQLDALGAFLKERGGQVLG